MLTAERVRELARESYQDFGPFWKCYEVPIGVFLFEIFARKINEKHYYHAHFELSSGYGRGVDFPWAKHKWWLLESKEAIFQAVADFINEFPVDRLQVIIDSVSYVKTESRAKSALERVAEDVITGPL